MESVLKIYLPVFFVAVILFAFVIPSWRTYNETGINPITFGKDETAQNYVGNVMKVLLGLLFVVILLYSLGGRFYKLLVPVFWLQKSLTVWTGLVLSHLALVWIIVAQLQMSTSWRIGIDEENKTELVTTGLFSISRNPIFLEIMVAVAGLFLIIPNVLTFFLTFAFYIVIQVQIRLEEELLIKTHGDKYKNYKLKTKRFL